MAYDISVINALATLRLLAVDPKIEDALNALDNAGVFTALDEQVDYADPSDILTMAMIRSLPVLDPAEWGDTTAADIIARRN